MGATDWQPGPARPPQNPRWDWWERAGISSQDAYRGEVATSDGVQSVASLLTLSKGTVAAAASPPNLARSEVAFGAHDAGTAGGIGFAAEHTTTRDWRIAEIHLSTTDTYVDWSDPDRPDGVPPDASVEWDWSDPYGWTGPATFTVAWRLRAGTLGGVGSAQVSLCSLPIAGAFLDDTARTDLSLWTELATATDGMPRAIAADYVAGMGVDPLTSAVAPIPGTWTEASTSTTIDPDDAGRVIAALALRMPELQFPPAPSGYPLAATNTAIPDGWDGSLGWDIYQAAAQIDYFTVSRAFTYPRYRWVWEDGAQGVRRLRQRQDAAGGVDGIPLRQRQHGCMTGSWPLRQRQRGI